MHVCFQALGLFVAVRPLGAEAGVSIENGEIEGVFVYIFDNMKGVIVILISLSHFLFHFSNSLCRKPRNLFSFTLKPLKSYQQQIQNHTLSEGALPSNLEKHEEAGLYWFLVKAIVAGINTSICPMLKGAVCPNICSFMLFWTQALIWKFPFGFLKGPHCLPEARARSTPWRKLQSIFD